nr:flavodoxin family protein [uncultured Clostridium sp.]
MKVLMLNGSPHKEGCTNRALLEVAGSLKAEGIDTELVYLGNKAIHGCIACGTCMKKGACVFEDDPVNEFIEKMKQADGLIVGSPVYYASANGALFSFLDRLFYAGGSNFAHKPGAAIASARRAGTTATLDALNKYFTIAQMPLVSSSYWNMVHGRTPQEVEQDLEGLYTMRTLGKNMAWLLKCIEAGKAAGIGLPKKEEKVWTNFIR